MRVHSIAAAYLAVLEAAVVAQEVYTITEWPGTCSAIYTSGTQSVIVVQSTITTTTSPTPLSDQAANSGSAFVLQIQQPSTYGSSKRASTAFWLMANGNTTSNGTYAAQFFIENGQLQLFAGGYYSTSPGVANQPFAASMSVGSINTTFSVTNGQLTWLDAAFQQNGFAQFFKTPAAAVDDAEVIVVFDLSVSQTPASWAPLYLNARAASAATASGSAASPTTSVIVSIIGYPAQSTIFSYAPMSSSMSTSAAVPPSMSAIPSSWQSLSTITAVGTPIGPNHVSQATSTPSGPPLYQQSSLSASFSMSSSISSSTTAQNTLPQYSALTSSSRLPSMFVLATPSSSMLSSSTLPLYGSSTNSTTSSMSMPTSLSSAASSVLYGLSTASNLPSPLLTTSPSSSVLPLPYEPSASTSMSIATSTTSSSSSSSSSSTVTSTSSTSVVLTTSSSAPLVLSSPSSTTATSSSSSLTFVTATGTTSAQSPDQYAASSSSPLGSSTTISAPSSTHTWTTPTYACPGVNGETVVDSWGVNYLIGCGQDTTYGNYDSQAVANSWDQCFWKCHNSTTTQGVGQCTAFTYSGAVNGNGSGTCFLKDQSGITFTGSGSGLVAAIQVAIYANASSSSSTQSTTTSSPLVGGAAPVTSSSVVADTSSTITSSLVSTISSSSVSSRTTTSSSVLSTTRSTTTSSITVTTSSVSSSTISSSSTSAYLVLASPTPCNFGDPAGTDEDDSYCEIDLPFSMTIYSVSAPQTFASTNGYISLVNGSSQYQVNPLPFYGIPNNTVLPLFDDLYVYGKATPTQGIFYQASSSGVTYEYYLGRANSSSAITHFTVGYSTTTPGVFTYTYYNVGNGNNGATSCIGIQGRNAAGNEADYQFSYQTASIAPGSVVVCNTVTNFCTKTQ